MDIKRALGQKLKSLREAKRLSQQQLAEKLGMSVDAVSMIERGLNWPTAKTLTAVADALGVSPTSLLSGLPSREYEVDTYVRAHQLLDQIEPVDLPIVLALLDALRDRYPTPIKDGAKKLV